MAAPNSTPTGKPTAVATPSFLWRAKIRVVDFFHPEFLRREHRRIMANLFTYRYAYMALAATILFAAAEYEQLGYIPRPPELTVGLFGFLGASAVIFCTYALMEYVENHAWPWDEEGFVWWWEAVLWSGTVYSDETLEDSVAIHDNTSIEASHAVESITPAGSPARSYIIIPPTPLLPRGLRPVQLPPPPTHRSGILGESPMPIKFKHFSGHLGLESVDEE